MSHPSSTRRLLVELYDAGIAGAAPGPLTASSLQDFPAKPDQSIWIYAIGKAAHSMAAAATTTLQRSMLRVAGGLVIGDEQLSSPSAMLAAYKGDHPVPGRNSFNAADRLGDAAKGKKGSDVALVLLSGGASSLVGAPLRGMSEADLSQLFEMLVASGLDIASINAVRKRFARWGAGRLALALAPARTYCYLMSDVIGDNPADIGSGPCTPDERTVKDVVGILEKAGLLARISPSMREYLTSVGRGVIPETPSKTHPAFAHVTARVIGTNRLALDAIAAECSKQSLNVERIATPLSGDAAARGAEIASVLAARASAGQKSVMLWGGETTVNLNSPSMHRAGGRSQELALSASRQLSQLGVAADRVSILAAGTDGRDGNSEAAGAFADGDVWAAIRAAGKDPDRALERHESNSALSAANALLPARHTGTNVMDVVIGVVE